MPAAAAAVGVAVGGRDGRRETAGRGRARDAAGWILVEDVGPALGVEAGVEDGFEHCIVVEFCFGWGLPLLLVVL